MRPVEKTSAIRWQIVNRHLSPGITVIEKLSQKIAGLSRLLVHFPPDAIHLQVVLEKFPKKGLFEVRLTLRLPSNILHAEKMGTDLLVTINTAVQALKREVMGLKAGLRGDYRWKRPARRAELNAVKEARLASPLPAGTDFEADFELIANLFAALNDSLLAHAGRVLRMAELTGDLPLGALDAGDIVDEVARLALDPRGEMPKPRSLTYQQWFFRLVQNEIDRQLHRFAEEMRLRAEPRLGIEFLPSDEAGMYEADRPLDLWGEKIGSQEESLLEERIVDHETVPPDAAIAGQELVERLQQEVKNWPPLERQVFELHYLVGLELGDVAMIVNQTEEKTRALVYQTQLRLRDFVRQSACLPLCRETLLNQGTGK